MPRGESAALRSLANAARTLDGTPGLMNLRMLQTIEQDAALPGTTRFVVHLPGGTAVQAADADEPDRLRLRLRGGHPDAGAGSRTIA